MFSDGYDLLQAGNATAAAAKFEEGLKQDSGNAVAHFYLGESYVSLRREADARAQFQLSLKLDPSSAVAGLAQAELAKFTGPAVAAGPAVVAGPAVAAVPAAPAVAYKPVTPTVVQPRRPDVHDEPAIGKVVPAIQPLPTKPSFDDACPYPAEARRRGDTGTVELLVLVAEDGSARKTVVDVSSGSEVLDRASVNCVIEAAHFQTRHSGSKPIPYWGRMKVHWTFGG